MPGGYNPDMSKKFIVVIAVTSLFLVIIVVSALMFNRLAKKPTSSSAERSVLPPISQTSVPQTPTGSNNTFGTGLRINAKNSPFSASISSIMPTSSTAVSSIKNVCGITFSSDVDFKPAKCQLKKIRGGVPCEDPSGCPASYEIEAIDSKGEVLQMKILSFKLRDGNYFWDEVSKKGDFLATLVTNDYSTVGLKNGSMTLKSTSSGSSVKVVLDLLFTNGFRISGTGEIPKVEELLP